MPIHFSDVSIDSSVSEYAISNSNFAYRCDRGIRSDQGIGRHTEVAKTASGVQVLWEAVFGVLGMLLAVGGWDEGDASFGADPGADSAARTLFHVQDVAPSESFGKQRFLVGILQCKSPFEDVLNPFIHLPEEHGAHFLTCPPRVASNLGCRR